MFTEERALLIELLTHRKINLFIFYENSCYSTGQIARTVFKYQRKGYLIKLGKYVVRTPIGHRELKRIRLSELAENKRYWATTRNEILRDKVAINEPIDIIKVPKM